MRYCDTSLLAPLVREERTSSQVARFLGGLPAGELAISLWTEVEFMSLLARDVRMGVIRGDEADEADALFAGMIRQSFQVILPVVDDDTLARRYLQNYRTGLRAGDALHLAIAGNHQADVVYSLDKTMIKAGKMLGLQVRRGISAH